jgi:hypothetical protein
VFATLREMVGEEEFLDIRAQLPQEYAALLARPEDPSDAAGHGAGAEGGSAGNPRMGPRRKHGEGRAYFLMPSLL